MAIERRPRLLHRRDTLPNILKENLCTRIENNTEKSQKTLQNEINRANRRMERQSTRDREEVVESSIRLLQLYQERDLPMSSAREILTTFNCGHLVTDDMIKFDNMERIIKAEHKIMKLKADNAEVVARLAERGVEL